jgi:peptide-N4-(N-acetyl-beta-glucosaminyl)asparagine amidase
MDVTKRYVRNFEKWGAPRTRASEDVLFYILDEIRKERRKHMTKQDRFRLEGEDMTEHRELWDYVVQGLVKEICKITVDTAHTPMQAGLDVQTDPEARTMS